MVVFCFGSNLAGIHGAGAARSAWQHHGAQWGVGEGPTGDSYALPTKDHQIQTLPLEVIAKNVERFKAYAALRSDLKFMVTRVGCGLAGYTDADIAPMFQDAPENCELPPRWREGTR